SVTAQILAGTEGGSFPFWSPDSRSIGFFADGKLKTMEVIGGSPSTVCEIADGRGGSWNAGGTIIFAGRYGPIYRVSASGGSNPVPVTAFDPAHRDATHRWPQFLPDGRHFLFLASPVGSEEITNTICAGSISGGMRKPLVSVPSSQAVYVNGYLIFVRDQSLFAHRFDTKTLTMVDEPFALAEREIEQDPIFSHSVFSASANG